MCFGGRSVGIFRLRSKIHGVEYAFTNFNDAAYIVPESV
jgi:hypothetical protein